MQDFWILTTAVHIMYFCVAITETKMYHVEYMYGDHLSIRLPSDAVKLEFNSVDETEQQVIWSKFQKSIRGRVTGSGSDRKFVIHGVKFDDQGTYTVFDFWNIKKYIYLLKVITKRSIQDCVAGETLNIYMEGLSNYEATLHFSNQDYNLTLVERGSPVGNSHPDYLERIKVISNTIEVLNVNVSDVGNYTLSDYLNRKVKIISMNLVDHHPGFNKGLLASLLLVIGIPSCICCCCRKRICKKKPDTNTATVKFDSQVNPPGPPPAYINPEGPPPVYTPGCPAEGESTIHPPPNPAFPPQPPYSEYPATLPAMPPKPGFNLEYSKQNPLQPPASDFSPAQSPQYNPPASVDFAPVMSNAPADPDTVKMDITATTPLLTPP